MSSEIASTIRNSQEELERSASENEVNEQPTEAEIRKSIENGQEKSGPNEEPAEIILNFERVSNDNEPVEDECDSQHLLYKNTESFRCLAQVLLSSSSLARQKLFHFPPLKDPGINSAFEFIEPEPVYDDIGVEKYISICKELEIVPLSRIKSALGEETLDLKYYGLTPKQLKALAETLKGNAYVQNLNLQDNWLNADQNDLLRNMLEENSTLRTLNLRECRISESGAKHLNEALSNSQFLSELDLSYNSLGDHGLLLLQQGLCESPLTKLNISHNNLTEDSAEILEQILSENKCLQELDLSWNGFYTGPGNKKLFNGLMKNNHITNLNLAWNGIGLKAAVAPLAKYIRRSSILEFLDLSNNRLVGPSLRMTRAAVLKNHSLISLKIGNNPYPPDEAYLMASVLTAKAKDPLMQLDMESMYFKKDVLPLLTRIRNMNKKIKIGGILSNYTIRGPNVNELLFKRCRYLLMKPKKKKARKDFGHFILSLPNQMIAKAEFETLLKKKKIKRLDKDLLTELMNKFAVKKTTVNCVEMTKAYMELYPDTCLPPEKEKKKKKKKKKGKKGKGKKKLVEEEKEIAVHNLEDGPGEGQILEGGLQGEQILDGAQQQGQTLDGGRLEGQSLGGEKEKVLDERQQEERTLDDEQQERQTLEDVQQEGRTLDDEKQEGQTLESVQQEGRTSHEEQQEGQTLEGVQQEGQTLDDEQQEGQTSEGVQQERRTLDGEQQEGLSLEGVQQKGQTLEGSV